MTCKSLCFHCNCGRCLTKLNHSSFQSCFPNANLCLYFCAFILCFSGTFFCFLAMPIQAHLYWAISNDNFSQVSDSSFKFHMFILGFKICWYYSLTPNKTLFFTITSFGEIYPCQCKYNCGAAIYFLLNSDNFLCLP